MQIYDAKHAAQPINGKGLIACLCWLGELDGGLLIY